MAHDEGGVPVEAAASLFGAADEAAVDFFATNFDNVPVVEGDNSSERSSSMQDSNAAANLFEAGPDENAPSLFPSTSHELQPGVGMDELTEATSQGQPHDATAHQNQGWQNEQGQRHNYDYQNGYTSTYDYASQQQSISSYAPQSNYIPPPYDHAQSSTGHDPSVPQYTGVSASQPDFSQRYTPSQPQQSQSHQATYTMPHTAPQSVDYSQNIYGQYSRAFHPTSSPSTVPPMLPQSTSTKKDINAYRPTTLNAYDPPIPTKARSKARSAFSTPPLSYPPFNDTHTQHAATPSQPPPPQPQQVRQDREGPSSISPSSILAAGAQNFQGGSHGSVGFHDSEQNSHPTTGTYQESTSATHLPSSDVTSTESFVGLHNEDVADSSQKDDFWHGDPEASTEATAYKRSVDDRGASYHGLSSLDPEGSRSPISNDTVAAVPINSSVHTSSEQSRVCGLDDQAFDHGYNPLDVPQHTTTSPPQTMLTSQIDDRAPHPPDGSSDVGSLGSQRNDDPYHPTQHSRQTSEGSHTSSAHSPPEPTSTPWNPYVPSTVSEASHRNSEASTLYDQFDAYGSHIVSSNGIPETSQDPYAPSSRLHQVQSRQSDFSYTGEYTSRYNHPNLTESGQSQGGTEVIDPDITLGPANVVTAPTYTPYAPSPSLLGTNDPLGRAAARIPVISFGFGGKLVSCFHSAGETSGGFDVALTARQSTDIQLRTLHEVIPASAMDSSASTYPGPLFFDPGILSISLARTVGVGTASNTKAKKAQVSKWLEERVNELSSGIAYIPSGSQERHNSEGRLVLLRLLKAMLDNDGQLSGSSSIEWAVRSALIPRLSSDRSSSNVDVLPSTDVPTYSTALMDTNEAPIAVYELRASALDRIQEFLLRGERRQAYHYAVDEKLWAHAMLIASSIDNQAWKDVVKEFLHSELVVKQPLGPLPGTTTTSTVPATKGRESLRVAYSLFAGYGAAAVQELIPPRAIPTHKDSLLIPQTGLHATPISPNFPQPALTSSVPPEVLSKWHETAAVMAFGQTAGDSAALTALGDYLAANRWFEAAHACYLLSPRTSSFGGTGAPSVRVVLVGSEPPSSLRNFSKDFDVTILSEIVEFALSLSPNKGQETFGGLPHLQAYKLIRAAHLAEMGYVEAANRYCEAIGSVIRASARGSPFYTPTFIGELKNLSDRLTAAPQLDKTASWISSKLSKPSLDSIGSWLESRFSNLIVGEGEGGPGPDVSEEAQPTKTNYGPFSHYSTISSATTSASPSPSPTPHVLNGMGTIPSVPFGVYGNHHTQIDRASSAMDHLRPQARRTSPVPRVASASAATTTFAQASNHSARYRPDYGAVSDVSESDGGGDTEGQEVSWWGSSSQDRSGPTPTAATFYKVDEGHPDGNFISVMDTYSPNITLAASSQSKVQDNDVEEDEEDLGFGNATKRTPEFKVQSSPEPDVTNKPESSAAPVVDKPELKQKTSSWFGRWWSRGSDSTTPGPIKAKLGEETSFYYDKELKRWVNKKAGGAETTTPTLPPPPPSRPRTASPAPGGPPVPKTTNGPPRPASAAEMAMLPRKPPRVRSNLVPTEESTTPGSAPPSATNFDSGSSLAPSSGIGRPKSSASKRNVRSRYVDVLQ